ncbi:hypothetical protein EVAR_4110_1 [Eumeta japonica]|uniref:Uncharacterized protein n=1 Tax=Eumeta variegata TaxID=151549 RepID=A0A4C1T7L1_EUMVA|nr:hypothetical protein EVAR_4110_1 [Eumeta japonica]
MIDMDYIHSRRDGGQRLVNDINTVYVRNFSPSRMTCHDLAKAVSVSGRRCCELRAEKEVGSVLTSARRTARRVSPQKGNACNYVLEKLACMTCDVIDDCNVDSLTS